MRVRRFIGDNVAETMGKVKRELGSEAVILQTREFREGGFLGLFGKMRVEISAAIEEKPAATDKLPDLGYGYFVEESALSRTKQEQPYQLERNNRELTERGGMELSERGSREFAERDGMELPERSGMELSERDNREFSEYTNVGEAERNGMEFVDNFLSRINVESDDNSYSSIYANTNINKNVSKNNENTDADIGANNSAKQPLSSYPEGGPNEEAKPRAGIRANEDIKPRTEGGDEVVTRPLLNFNANLSAYRNAAELGANSKTAPETNIGSGQEANEVISGADVKNPPKPAVEDDFKKQNQLIQDEISAMRKMLEKMNKHMEGMGEEPGGRPLPLQKWADFLEERGINQNLVNLILRHIQQTLQPEEWHNDAQVYSRLEANVRQICGQIGLIQPGLDKPRVVALIGATGVGKTTTIGKLAAGFSIVDKRRVALITVDTYRVAAVEQLKTFGEIIGVPVKVVMTPAGLREAIDDFADRELIFIDTAGRSPYHDLHMSELQAFLEHGKPDFTMLVLSATTQYADQIKVYRRFEPLTTHLIFTKLDETGSAGSILNILGQTTLPTAYLSNGQNVPDDIEAATPNRLARYVLGVDLPNV